MALAQPHAPNHVVAGPEVCQVCGGQDFVPEIEHAGMQYYRCRECDLVFLYPPPDPDSLATSTGDADSGGTGGSFGDAASTERRARRQVRRIVAELPGGAVGKRFLDVGCSGGFIAEAARTLGFNAVGIDVDADAVTYARKHYPLNRFHVGVVETFRPADGRLFNAVYCADMLEHVGDVNHFIAALSRLLKTGGLLYLTTPDFGHWRRPKDLASWDAFRPPHNCSFFSDGNLRRLLAHHRLDVFKRQLAFKPGIKVLARRVVGQGRTAHG